MVVPARWILCACGVLVSFSAELPAAPRLAAIFGDQMVLQQGREVAIWGWAEAGEKIDLATARRRVREAEAFAEANKSPGRIFVAASPGREGRARHTHFRSFLPHITHSTSPGTVWIPGGCHRLAAVEA